VVSFEWIDHLIISPIALKTKGLLRKVVKTEDLGIHFSAFRQHSAVYAGSA
jgi:hypothetical protein